MATHQKLRIAIVGGGVGGLALGVALTKLNVLDSVQVDIYESTSKLSQVGAGVSFWPRVWEVLKKMGLEDSLTAKLSSDEQRPSAKQLRMNLKLRKSNQPQGVAILEETEYGPIPFHRADVQSVLIEHLSELIPCHLSHRLLKYRETQDQVELQFTNGNTATCDILVGADGIHSVIRKSLLREEHNCTEEESEKIARPLWTGIFAYRCLVNAEVIRREAPNHIALENMVIFLGKNRILVAYPIQQGRFINVAPMVSHPGKEGTYLDGPSVIPSSVDDIAPHYDNWEEDAQILVKHAVTPSRWAVDYVKPIDKYRSRIGRVILLGDSAHAAPPFFANGAGLAIESAYFLANIIAKERQYNNPRNIDLVSKITHIYDAERRPFCNALAAASLELGNLYLFKAPGLETLGDGFDLPQDKVAELQARLSEGLEWTRESAMVSLERAVAAL